MNVYLAGGMRSNWQDKVMAAVPEGEYLDPRSHGLFDEAAYTAWDIQAVMDAKIVYCCLEADDPSGYGAVFEMGIKLGMRLALGAEADALPVIFVDEMSPADQRRARYLGMMRQSATFYTHSREEGYAELRRLIAKMQNEAK